MCARVEVFTGDEVPLATSAVLCPTWTEHVISTLSDDVADDDKTQILFRAVAGEAAFVVCEHDYFDVDFRSEYSLTHETHFRRRTPTTARLHFFSSVPIDPIGDEMLANLQHLAGSYLGYSILRPEGPGIIGRTVLPLRPAPDTVTVGGLPAASRVRTSIFDPVTLFGVRMHATGVPFMQQDGHLLRCAHVVSWVAHYTASLRGLAYRRPSGHFHLASRTLFASSREYPSLGMTTVQITDVLSRFGLPPEQLLGSKRTRDKARWYDRKMLWRLSEISRPADRNRAWLRERISSSICRHLNSGFPVVLGMEDEQGDEHAVTICGYLRLGQLAPAFRAELEEKDSFLRTVLADLVDPEELESEVVGFLVANDRRSPYDVFWLSQIVEKAADVEGSEVRVTGSVTLLAPLPSGLWLPADGAETIAGDTFYDVLQRAASDDWAAGMPESSEKEDFREAIAEMVHARNEQREGPYALRAYATTGSDFKLRIERRCRGVRRNVAERAAYLRLPRFVWVVELVDRSRRNAGVSTTPRQNACIMGEVVIDASSPDVASASILFVNVPGAVSRGQDSSYWYETDYGPYRSGRWDHSADAEASSEAAFVRMKGTTIDAVRAFT